MTLTAHQNAQLRLDFAATMAWAKLSTESAKVAWQSAQETEKACRCYRAIANSLTWEKRHD